MSSRWRNLLQSYPPKPGIIWKNIRWRFPDKKSNGQYIFVVGSPRSGTTLLQSMLTAHSKLFSIEAESGLFSYKNLFDASRFHFGLPRSQSLCLLNQCSDIVEFFDAAVVAVNGNPNVSSRFVEKTPQHVLHLPFIFKWFPNAKVIHIVRDGRDCYCSSKIHADVPQNKSVRMFANYWKKCVSRPIRYKGSNRLYTIKYENLVSSPQTRLTDLMQYLDLDTEITQLDPTRFSSDARSQLTEFKKLATEINDSSVSRWRREMTKEEADLFNKIAGETLRFYGYTEML